MYCIQREAVTSMEQRPPLPPEQAVEYFADTVLRAAFGMVKNLSDAEDIAQDTFVSLVRASPQFESLEHQKAWLLRVAINRSKSHLTSAWMRCRTELDDALPDAFTPQENIVLDAVAALPVKYRQVVYLHYIEGYTAAEIARILRSNPNTVLSQLSRARAKLREALKGEFADEV